MGPALQARILRRTGTAAVTLILVSWIVFALAHLAPGDALGAAEGEDLSGTLTPQRRAELRALYHLDEPVHRQYALWARDVLRGELGRSFHDRRPVARKIGERLGITVTLNALALGAMVLLAVPLGALAALRPGSWLDRWTASGTYLLWAVPVFWGALLLQMLFAVRLGWFPLAGLETEGASAHGLAVRWSDRAAHLVLPVICLAYPGLAYLARFVRANLLDNALPEAARAARARGLSEYGVLLRHGFRQAAVPLLTLAGLILPGLVSGSVIVERIFAIPGLGRLLVDAVFQRDVPVIMAITLLSAVATLAGILASDVAYVLLDPRVRRGRA
jgi:peptide/nickel transport system permease protein